MDNTELETFIKMFDAALTSNDPSVKKALKNLLIITTLYQDEDAITKGPLETLFSEVKSLAASNSDMKLQLSHLNKKLYTIECKISIQMQSQYPMYPVSTTSSTSLRNYGISDINWDDPGLITSLIRSP